MADYTFPSYLVVRESRYSRSEGQRFIASQPSAGPYFVQIVSDDVPVYFDFEIVAKNQADALAFRSWLISDNFAVLSGATFTMQLWTEYGLTVQTASFADGGTPQLVSTIGNIFIYSCRISLNREVGGSPLLTESSKTIETQSGIILEAEKG